MSDLRRYVAEQRAESPEFKRAYDEDKALEAKARRLVPILRLMGYESMTWITILAVLHAASDMETEVLDEDRQ